MNKVNFTNKNINYSMKKSVNLYHSIRKAHNANFVNKSGKYFKCYRKSLNIVHVSNNMFFNSFLLFQSSCQTQWLKSSETKKLRPFWDLTLKIKECDIKCMFSLKLHLRQLSPRMFPCSHPIVVRRQWGSPSCEFDFHCPRVAFWDGAWRWLVRTSDFL